MTLQSLQNGALNFVLFFAQKLLGGGLKEIRIFHNLDLSHSSYGQRDTLSSFHVLTNRIQCHNLKKLKDFVRLTSIFHHFLGEFLTFWTYYWANSDNQSQTEPIFRRIFDILKAKKPKRHRQNPFHHLFNSIYQRIPDILNEFLTKSTPSTSISFPLEAIYRLLWFDFWS